MPHLHLVSLGCTKNLVDSEIMLGRLKKYAITDDPAISDIIIVNTCGFIDAAKAESVETILDLHAQRKEDSLLIVTGCLSERYRDELQQELPEVDLFSGLGDFDKIDSIIAGRESRFTEDIFLLDDQERVITGSHIHAYVKLSEGCNQACAFCAIPLFRGKLKSRTLQTAIDEVRNLSERGYADLSFISQDTSSYLRDCGEKEGIIRLLEQLESVDTLRSARLLYLYPSTLSPEMISAVAASTKVHNYFDMPIQHITKHMLKTMKRGIDADTHLQLLKQMRGIPNSFLRTSIIAGHPGETQEDFDALCAFLKAFQFDRVNVFGYSDEEGTASYAMDELKIPREVIEERVSILEEITTQNRADSLHRDVGQEIDVILEGESGEHAYFLSARRIDWAPDIDGEILINDTEIKSPEPGFYRAKVTGIAGDNLIATLLKQT